MATSIEVTVKPDGQINEFTISYEYGESQATLCVNDGVNGTQEYFTHQDLTELINALMKVREEMGQ